MPIRREDLDAEATAIPVLAVSSSVDAEAREQAPLTAIPPPRLSTVLPLKTQTVIIELPPLETKTAPHSL